MLALFFCVARFPAAFAKGCCIWEHGVALLLRVPRFVTEGAYVLQVCAPLRSVIVASTPRALAVAICPPRVPIASLAFPLAALPFFLFALSLAATVPSMILMVLPLALCARNHRLHEAEKIRLSLLLMPCHLRCGGAVVVLGVQSGTQ